MIRINTLDICKECIITIGTKCLVNYYHPSNENNKEVSEFQDKYLIPGYCCMLQEYEEYIDGKLVKTEI